MAKPNITQLTSEQEALVPVYREKWRKIALSTERIDQEEAAEAIKSAYLISNYPEPKILFYRNPLVAIQETISIKNFQNRLGREVNTKFSKRVFGHIEAGIKRQIDKKLFLQIINQVHFPVSPHYSTPENFRLSGFPYFFGIQRAIEQQLLADIEKLLPESEFSDISYLTGSLTIPTWWAIWMCIFDFCISVLNLHHDRNKWRVLQQLVQSCGLLFRYENVCIACDRPSLMLFDQENVLHAEGKPALQFPDGYCTYAYHGVDLPEKYGKVHPNKWQASWLLEEPNAELRRVLIQGIGYDRICQELQASELDNWREYTLLKIDADIDAYEPPSWDSEAPPREPIYLLKMTCPSTGHIYALRVPPAMTTAREAIKWVNWDIDPESLAVQT